MSGNSSTTGPHFTPEGRSYFITNGKRVWGALPDPEFQSSTRSSNSNRAPSVVSDFEARRLLPKPTEINSYPPVTPPSGMKTRMTTGYPEARFNVGQSEGSAPASGHKHLDPYRNAVDEKHNKTGPPLDSSFIKSYNHYKDLDTSSVAAKAQYKEYSKTARKVTQKMRKANPGVFEGEPKESKEWHETAASYAARGRDIANSAADFREKMAADYVGYDTRKGAEGHRERAEIVRHIGSWMEDKHALHSKSHKD